MFEKIEELEEIEKVSTSPPTPETAFIFKQATLKLNVMVFKRNVFESRKRSKGVLRPKIKPLLKDIVHVSIVLFFGRGSFISLFNLVK